MLVLGPRREGCVMMIGLGALVAAVVVAIVLSRLRD
jgi:hypothetical protein